MLDEADNDWYNERDKTMKQYTNESQTAKLMELGFEPSTRIPFEVGNDELGRTFSIGELIEMLPKDFDGEQLEIASVTLSCAKWMVRYPYGIIVYKNELIDALYAMILQLKEEGII